MLPGNLRHSHIDHQIKKLQKNWNSSTNLLFLDFDGVLIVPRKDKDEFLKRIHSLTEKYNFKAVITSTWRMNMDNCHQILDDIIEIDGRTDLNEDSRSQQILNYLSTHPFQHFLILDDLFMEELQEYQVHTDFFIGFDEKSYQLAFQIIERQIQQKSEE